MSKKPKLLYVDDESVNLMLFEINFRDKYQVLTADNALKGLALLDEHKDISAVISDMKMPHMSGIEYIRKAKDRYPAIPYFILTGYDVTDEIQEALDRGLILKCFQKPFNINEIASSVEESINNK